MYLVPSDFRVGSRKTSLWDVAGRAGVARGIRQRAVVEHQLPEFFHWGQLDDIRRQRWRRKRPAQYIRAGVVVSQGHAYKGAAETE